MLLSIAIARSNRLSAPISHSPAMIPTSRLSPSLSLSPTPVRLVGKGSFGSVYLVSRRRDGAQFVLKNMQITNVPEKEIESYQNEVRLLTELEHPGIVSHVESFIDGDKQHMCIVMSFCEGGDLAAYLKHKKGIPMREGEILFHFVQMCMGLHYMHEKSILHRQCTSAHALLCV